MKYIQKIYLSNFMIFLIPIIIVTGTIYIVVSQSYLEMSHERNLLQLTHLSRQIESYLADITQSDIQLLAEDIYLADGSVLLLDQTHQLVDGAGITDQPDLFQDLISKLNLDAGKKILQEQGFYIYPKMLEVSNLTLLYLRSRKIVNAPLYHFRLILFLVFSVMVCLFFLFQKKALQNLLLPLENLFKMVWGFRGHRTKARMRLGTDDEVEIVKSIIVEQQNLLKDRDFKLKRNLFSVMDILIDLLEIKDSYTASHSRQVRKFSIAIAQTMGIEEEGIRDIAFAATLHDIGKIGVSHTILNKPGKLTVKEFATIKQHPTVADEVLKNIDELQDIRKTIRHHHENFDGMGYPDGLKGAEIPLAARVVSVADAFDAMTSDRPYRKALSFQRAIQILLEEKGKQFDPQVVDALITYLFQQGLLGESAVANE